MILKKSDDKNHQSSDNRSRSRSARGGTPGLFGHGIADLCADSYVLFDIPDNDTDKQLEQSINLVCRPSSRQRRTIPMGWSTPWRIYTTGRLVRPAAEPGEPLNRTDHHGDEHFRRIHHHEQLQHQRHSLWYPDLHGHGQALAGVHPITHQR